MPKNQKPSKRPQRSRPAKPSRQPRIEYDSQAYWEETAGYDYGEINAALNALDPADPNYSDRQSTLLERLMCADMAMGPARRDMGKRKRPVATTPATPPAKKPNH